VLFENGNAVVFTTNGELTLAVDQGRPLIRGRLGLTEYVARVLDREADPNVAAAARALAIVARTWTVRNAPLERGCYQVADSTRMQRVSPNAATPAARAAALFTDGLVLDTDDVRYHRDTAAANVLGWTSAVADARAGQRFDAILARSFPHASLATMTGDRECRRAGDLAAWLAQVEPLWRRRLAAKPGFEPPGALVVCALDEGNPFADRARMRIFVRNSATRDNRISIAHEYVHLAFQYHPAGGDERFVEDVARSLVQ
jgi:uncharacterized protein YfaQ (DUF2300 family)